MTRWVPVFKGVTQAELDVLPLVMSRLMAAEIPFSVTNRSGIDGVIPTLYVTVNEVYVHKAREIVKDLMVCPKLEMTQLRGKSAALCTCGPFDVCPKRREEVSPECWTIGGETRQK